MNGTQKSSPEERLQLREELRASMVYIDGVRPADTSSRMSAGARRRTGFDPRTDTTRLLTLIEVDGVLFWEDGAGQAIANAGLRRGIRGRQARGEIIDRVRVDELEPSKIGDYLASLDKKLTPDQGLRRWDGTQLVPLAANETPAAAGKILLLVHGTFSKSDMFIEAFDQTQEGRDLLGRAGQKYDQILAFDHPTMSVSPFLNAVDLSRAFAGSKADVDLVCHSRGGLVARWWLEELEHNRKLKRRAVFVGSPLVGTSLASPPRIRSLLSWFSNLNRVLSHGAAVASTVLPFMTVISGLLRFTALASSVISKTPVADALIALVPGLASMSMIGNNFELRRLNVESDGAREYFVVQSNFQPADPAWKFWKYFVDPLKAGDKLTDVIFPGKNDLVVDTSSMTYLSETKSVPANRVYDFGDSDVVHHTNYFVQEKTIDFIADKLQI
jgi:pimeloyl-ACP methyl ester carboxylesterase